VEPHKNGTEALLVDNQLPANVSVFVPELASRIAEPGITTLPVMFSVIPPKIAVPVLANEKSPVKLIIPTVPPPQIVILPDVNRFALNVNVSAAVNES
jgi:hypothetical protein